MAPTRVRPRRPGVASGQDVLGLIFIPTTQPQRGTLRGHALAPSCMGDAISRQRPAIDEQFAGFELVTGTGEKRRNWPAWPESGQMHESWPIACLPTVRSWASGRLASPGDDQGRIVQAQVAG